jgi:hypothetical protein
VNLRTHFDFTALRVIKQVRSKVAPTLCEWKLCRATATHTVTVDYPNGRREVWLVCTDHDADLKNLVQRSLAPGAPPGFGFGGGLGRKHFRSGRKGWLTHDFTGRSLGKFHGTWTERELDRDAVNDLYRERLAYHDGTVLESKAKLSDHTAGQSQAAVGFRRGHSWPTAAVVT